MTTSISTYEADRSIRGKLRRRWMRLYARRPARGGGPGHPRLSVTFDDAPITATTTGAQIVAAHGGKATYFIAASLLGTDGLMGPYAAWRDVERLRAQGHEIGCHTWGHADLGHCDGPRAEQEVMLNHHALAAHGVPAPHTFAYPYGEVSAAPKAALSSRFSLLRALHHGLIEPGADLNQAPSVGLEGHSAERKAWLILNAHDVQATPSPWGCTPETLQRVLDCAQALGFELITVAEGARQAA
jgi:peptidoglycan/xylan/chitin deacetylase (PgdA/CDA1 family)